MKSYEKPVEPVRPNVVIEMTVDEADRVATVLLAMPSETILNELADCVRPYNSGKYGTVVIGGLRHLRHKGKNEIQYGKGDND